MRVLGGSENLQHTHKKKLDYNEQFSFLCIFLWAQGFQLSVNLLSLDCSRKRLLQPSADTVWRCQPFPLGGMKVVTGGGTQTDVQRHLAPALS